MNERPTVVIIGAGFGGLEAAKALASAPVDVLLIDQHNYHTFQPLLYQVASAALTPEEISHAVHGIFQRQRNLTFRLGKVVAIDKEARFVTLEDGASIGYDYLVMAPGTIYHDFGVPGVREHAFFLKSISEAVNLRSHLLAQFEAASADPALLEQGALTVVIAGGGPTGVELAGALVELFSRVLAKDFKELPLERARVVLLELAPALLGPYHPDSQAYTLKTLKQRGVEVRLNTTVTRVEAQQVHLGGEVISTRTLIWAAGVRASPLAEALGVPLTRGARVPVAADLSLPDYPELFVIGDMSASQDAAGKLHPQVAQLAIQGGKHTAKQLRRRLRGQPGEAFKYRDLGSMATIGRSAAVAELPFGLRLKGFVAWLAWLFLHLLYLVGFRNRLTVILSWAAEYLTYNRHTRLLTPMVPSPTEQQSRSGRVQQTAPLIKSR